MGAAGIRRVSDPVQRAKQAADAMAALEVERAELMRIRDDAVREAVSRRVRLDEIGEVLGMTKSRVSQIAHRRYSK